MLKQMKNTFLCISIILLISIISIVTTNINNVEALDKKEQNVEKTDKKFKVDIKGAIINPGVYELKENSRIIDAINAAGGLADGANTNLLNLSKKITDEMVIIIYTNEQIENYKNSKIKTEYIYQTEYVYIEVDSCPDKINQACISDYKEDNTTTDNTNENNTTSNEKININTADVSELTKLSGIGESKANSIIEYRNNNGNFKDISEISNVKGLGSSIFEKIKDNITI